MANLYDRVARRATATLFDSGGPIDEPPTITKREAREAFPDWLPHVKDTTEDDEYAR